MQWVDRIGSRLKLRDLHILLTVVQRGSMAKAAAELAISQPAVSKAIADMEHTFGLRLLDRGRSGVEPTAYGRALVTRGQAIFDELKLGVEELAFLADPTVGELHIASTESVAAGLFPPSLERFSREQPGIRVNVAQAVMNTAHYRELRERSIDLLIGRIPDPFTRMISRRRSYMTIRRSWWRAGKANGHDRASSQLADLVRRALGLAAGRHNAWLAGRRTVSGRRRKTCPARPSRRFQCICAANWPHLRNS